MKIKKYKNGSCSVTKVHVSFNFFQLLRVILCVIIFHAKREIRILRGKIIKK